MQWQIILTIPWCIFFVVWVVSAFFTRATVKRESAAARASYGFPLAFGCLLLFSHAFKYVAPWLEQVLWDFGDAGRIIGLILSFDGVAFTFWARATLGNLWSGNITLKEGHHLVTRGPYALARHPIYTGMSLAFIGTAFAFGTTRAVLGAAIAIGSFIYKLGREERLMADNFGEEHARYRAKVKRLIPFVW
jgi:protein-S-isoprenylcysteine O-methyltransferase Ste14